MYNRTTRFVTGAAIIIAVLTMPQLPAWLSLVTIYPVITGIIKWDPFYALIKMLSNNVISTPALPNRTRSASA
jgi:hypothetical protein